MKENSPQTNKGTLDKSKEYSFCKDNPFFSEKKELRGFSWKKFVDSGKVRIFAGDNYMLNLNPAARSLGV